MDVNEGVKLPFLVEGVTGRDGNAWCKPALWLE